MGDLDGVLQIPFLSKGEIAGMTEELLGECWDGVYPVDVEKICDYCGVAIVPVRGLMDECQVEAFMAADFGIIYVDEYGYKNNSHRYRFSVAHELGHYMLHREYFSNRVDSYDEWRALGFDGISNVAEFQANYYAGCLLAPEAELAGVLNDKFGGSLARNYWSATPVDLSRIFGEVKRIFGVSRQVIMRRMREFVWGIEGC